MIEWEENVQRWVTALRRFTSLFRRSATQDAVSGWLRLESLSRLVPASCESVGASCSSAIVSLLYLGESERMPSSAKKNRADSHD
jgi:hypothetical protein